MRRRILVLLATSVVLGCSSQAMADISLGTAGDFAILAGETVTNTGATVIDGGDVGLSHGTSFTGFPPGNLKSPYQFRDISDPKTTQAHNDLQTAFDAAKNLTTFVDLSTLNLGGMTLTPGVYHFSSEALLTGADLASRTLTLDAQNDPNAQFVFQIGSKITTASYSTVTIINGGSTPDCGIYWQIGSSATLGTYSSFAGHIMAQTSITMTTGVTLDGSALVLGGSVTLDANTITNCNSGTVARAVPEPASIGLTFFGGLMMLSAARRRHRLVKAKQVATS